MIDIPKPLQTEVFKHDTGIPDFHAVQTIQLGDLIESGVFTWERVGWKAAAYSDVQYTRLCELFEGRFWLREISITPVGQWIRRLGLELKYNIMPKYKPLYAQLESGEYDPLQSGGEYRKERKIESDFPETLLSENQDYASKGYDFAGESVGRGNLADDYANYIEKFSSIDDMILNELERKFFSCLYSANVNGL